MADVPATPPEPLFAPMITENAPVVRFCTEKKRANPFGNRMVAFDVSVPETLNNRFRAWSEAPATDVSTVVPPVVLRLTMPVIALSIKTAFVLRIVPHEFAIEGSPGVGSLYCSSGVYVPTLDYPNHITP